MTLYEQLAQRVVKETTQELQSPEDFLAKIEAATGQSREGWPAPELLTETSTRRAHWRLIFDESIEFYQQPGQILVARLRPSVCIAYCAIGIHFSKDLELLIRRHLDGGAAHWPTKSNEPMNIGGIEDDGTLVPTFQRRKPR